MNVKVFIAFLIFVVLALGLYTFKERQDNIKEVILQEVVEENATGKYKVIRFDGCQYVEKTIEHAISYKGYGFMAHKGNCDNPIHKCN